MENNSDEQFWDFLKRNLFAVKKLILGLDDCVSKKDFDDAQIKIYQLEIQRDDLQKNFDDSQVEIQQLKNKCDDLGKKVDDAQVEIQQLENQRDGLQKNFDDSQVTIEKLTNHKTRLENEVDNKSSEIISLLREKSGLQNKVENLDESLKSARQEIETYRQNYSELEQAYQNYLQLPDDIKFGLQGIFGAGDNPTVFLAGALQNLDALFDYVANAINQGNGNVENLCAIFEFAFATQNKIHREEIFAPLNVKLGDDFNSATMRKISASRQSGVVQKILLRGYKYRASGNIIRKTLVDIG